MVTAGDCRSYFFCVSRYASCLYPKLKRVRISACIITFRLTPHARTVLRVCTVCFSLLLVAAVGNVMPLARLKDVWSSHVEAKYYHRQGHTLSWFIRIHRQIGTFEIIFLHRQKGPLHQHSDYGVLKCLCTEWSSSHQTNKALRHKQLAYIGFDSHGN